MGLEEERQVHDAEGGGEEQQQAQADDVDGVQNASMAAASSARAEFDRGRVAHHTPAPSAAAARRRGSPPASSHRSAS